MQQHRNKTKRPAPANPPGFTSRLKGKWQDVTPIIRYIAGFVALIVVFYAVYSSSFFNEKIIGPAVKGQARLASMALNVFGQNTAADNGTLTSQATTLNVAKGCDGMEPLALFVIGVLLVPLPWRRKWVGLGWGIGVLFVLNLARIVGLYLSKVHFPSTFDFLHLHGGFAIFTAITILVWVAWARWAIQQERNLKANV